MNGPVLTGRSPQVQSVADVQELLLAVELELVQGFRPSVPSKAIELLPVYTDDVSQIAIPAKNRPEDVVEFGQPELVRDLHHPDHHRIHVVQHGP